CAQRKNGITFPEGDLKRYTFSSVLSGFRWFWTSSVYLIPIHGAMPKFHYAVIQILFFCVKLLISAVIL
ncbi:MAG: hypothetical protein ACLSS9_10690, partial [Acutalibacteraceae bacterium]